MSERLKIYFLGSGDIAIPVLRRLATAAGIELVGVGTQIDRPAGRRQRPTPTPLGAAALELGLYPERIPDVNTPEFVHSLRERHPQILLVVSFGQLLKRELLELPGCICVNVHASLLPLYRGASPIEQCILNGDDRTGVCFMRMVAALDAGPVYAVFEQLLNHREFAGELEWQLGELAAEHAEEVLNGIASGALIACPQDESRRIICRKIRKPDGCVDWNYPARRIEAMVRAYTPWPGARCEAVTSRGPCTLTLRRVAIIDGLDLAPGEVASARLPRRLIVGCGDRRALEILELAPAGSRTMNAAGFLNGLRGESPKFTQSPVTAP